MDNIGFCLPAEWMFFFSTEPYVAFCVGILG